MEAKRKSVNLESIFIGDEPTWGDPKKELPIIRALSWYSNQKDWKDSKKYTLEYVKINKFSKEIFDGLSSAHEDLFKNLGFVCRMIQRGATIDKSEWISSRIDEIINFSSKNSLA